MSNTKFIGDVRLGILMFTNYYTFSQTVLQMMEIDWSICIIMGIMFCWWFEMSTQPLQHCYITFKTERCIFNLQSLAFSCSWYLHLSEPYCHWTLNLTRTCKRCEQIPVNIASVHLRFKIRLDWILLLFVEQYVSSIYKPIMKKNLIQTMTCPSFLWSISEYII